jgi:hypothetical protein
MNTEEIRELVQKISGKSIRKRLLNGVFYLRMGIISLIVTLICFILIIILSMIDKDNYFITYLTLISILSFAFLIKFFINAENKDFYNYESYQRQFCILYLLNEIYNNKIINKKKKKQQLWSLSKYYLVELNKTINSFRMLNFFNISQEENEIRKLKDDYNNKIIGNLITEEYDENMNQIITNLLDIIISIYPSKEIKDLNQINDDNMDRYDKINRLLINLSISDAELSIFGLVNILNKINKKFVSVFVIVILTLFVTAIYILVDIKKTGDYSIPTIFSLLIGTPIAVELFYNIIGKLHKE